MYLFFISENIDVLLIILKSIKRSILMIRINIEMSVYVKLIDFCCKHYMCAFRVPNIMEFPLGDSQIKDDSLL